jgi:monoamine oxidase
MTEVIVATRREFLLGLAKAGGYAATFTMMQSMGLLASPTSEDGPPSMISGSGKGVKVLILGAGIAGMAAAWELKKAGYLCTVIEARGRAGGRNWSIRNGTRVELTDGTVQTCDFEAGHYFNAGPARLPSIHRNILGYCKEFGVPLEVEVNSSRSALLQSNSMLGGKPVEMRQAVNDTRGHVSELLAKAVNRNALNDQLTKDDKERMIEFLKKYGDLSPDLFYKGSERSGYKVPPSATLKEAVPRDPLSMRALLDGDLWDGMLFEEMFDMQATMFQPVGGMDRIPAAFETRLSDVIQFHSAIQQIQKTQTGVRVRYQNTKTKEISVAEADYCICTLPLSVLKNIPSDLSPELKQAIDGTHYDSAYKIAWESPRFWEQESNIYGGISFLHQPDIFLVWYPSAGMFSPTGVVVAGYGVENGSPLALMTYEGKLAASRRAIDQLHPGKSSELKKPIYVCWGKVPYNLGSWVGGFGRQDQQAFGRLIEADDRIYLAGDHTSHLVGWQEGAVLSAYRVIGSINERVRASNLTRA